MTPSSSHLWRITDGDNVAWWNFKRRWIRSFLPFVLSKEFFECVVIFIDQIEIFFALLHVFQRDAHQLFDWSAANGKDSYFQKKFNENVVTRSTYSLISHPLSHSQLMIFRRNVSIIKSTNKNDSPGTMQKQKQKRLSRTAINSWWQNKAKKNFEREKMYLLPPSVVEMRPFKVNTNNQQTEAHRAHTLRPRANQKQLDEKSAVFPSAFVQFILERLSHVELSHLCASAMGRAPPPQKQRPFEIIVPTTNVHH